MKNRRKDKRGFSVLLDKEKLDKFDEVLEEKNLTKKEWLEEKSTRNWNKGIKIRVTPTDQSLSNPYDVYYRISIIVYVIP